jgi:hypothetical protein
MKLQQSRQSGFGKTNRQLDQWNQTEKSKLDPQKYRQLIFEKEQRQFKREKIIFSTKGPGTLHALKVNPDTDLTPFTKKLTSSGSQTSM